MFTGLAIIIAAVLGYFAACWLLARAFGPECEERAMAIAMTGFIPAILGGLALIQ